MMHHSRVLKICLICLFIAACDTQQLPSPDKQSPEIETSPEKSASQTARPSLDLSIDNFSLQENSDAVFLNDNGHTVKQSDLFKTLNKEQAESNIDISGKIFTDEEKLENKEYLDSVEGMQINIEGEFELN